MVLTLRVLFSSFYCCLLPRIHGICLCLLWAVHFVNDTATTTTTDRLRLDVHIWYTQNKLYSLGILDRGWSSDSTVICPGITGDTRSSLLEMALLIREPR